MKRVVNTMFITMILIVISTFIVQASAMQSIVLRGETYQVPETIPKDFTEWPEVCLGNGIFNYMGNRIEGHLHVFDKDLMKNYLVFVFYIIEDGTPKLFAIFYKIDKQDMVAIDFDGDKTFEIVKKNIHGETS